MLRSRNVKIATEDQPRAAGVNFANIVFHIAQELHFCHEIFTAIWNVGRDHHQTVHLRCDHAGFEIERRMKEARFLGKSIASYVQTDSGVSARAMPVTSIALELAKRRGNLRHGGLQFLKADYVRALALDPFEHLRFARANAVDVPGSNLQRRHNFLQCRSIEQADGNSIMNKPIFRSRRLFVYRWSGASGGAKAQKRTISIPFFCLISLSLEPRDL